MTTCWQFPNVENGKPGRFFLRGISAQAKDSVTLMEQLEAIRTRYQPTVDAEKNAKRMGAVVDFLLGRSIFNAKQLTKGVNMPSKLHANILRTRAGRGIMRKMTGYAHNQIYRADEIFKTLDNSEG